MWRYAYPGSSDVKPSRVSWRLVGRVLSFARPYRALLVVLLILILIQTAFSLVQPLIIRDLLDNVLPMQDYARLNILVLMLVTLPILSSSLSVIIRRLNAGVGEGVIFDLRRLLYSHLQRMSLRFFTNTRSGELISRLNNDVVNAQGAISDTIIGTVTNAVQVIATLAVMLTLEWRLTILGLLIFPIFIFIARGIGNRLREIARRAMDINAEMNAMMTETLNVSGALLVKLFGRRTMEIDRFADRASRVRDIGIRRAVLGSTFFAILGLVGVIGSALVYWGGGRLVMDGTWEIGTLVAFGAYLGGLYSPLQYLINIPVEFATSMVSFERVFEVVDLPMEIAEKPNALALTTVQGRLEFQNVTFRYDGGDALSEVRRYGQIDNVRAVLSGSEAPKPDAAKNGEAAPKPLSQARDVALDGLSFVIEPGQLVALVGPSGAGKTTLTYLIPRLYDPTEGRILLDDHDLRDLTLDSLTAQVGMVTQETYLFHDTIRTNLLYARDNATDAQIIAAAQAANIHDFIMELSDGYDTIVGERGYRLSGGEKQRLAIARVILKDPRVLVLDEATSHLDSQSEALIQDALETIMTNRTSIVIAHRLSTILAADQILVVDRGRIVEHGTHDALIDQNGLYAQLYETQFRQREIS